MTHDVCGHNSIGAWRILGFRGGPGASWVPGMFLGSLSPRRLRGRPWASLGRVLGVPGGVSGRPRELLAGGRGRHRKHKVFSKRLGVQGAHWCDFEYREWSWEVELLIFHTSEHFLSFASCFSVSTQGSYWDHPGIPRESGMPWGSPVSPKIPSIPRDPSELPEDGYVQQPHDENTYTHDIGLRNRFPRGPSSLELV